MKLNLKSPSTITIGVKKVLETLGLHEQDLVFLDYKNPIKFVPAILDCHLNVWVQCSLEEGSPLSGWMVFEDEKHSFIEAHFHTVWRSPLGELQDITPRHDKEKTIMFFPDPIRKITIFDVDGNLGLKTYTHLKILNNNLLSKPDEMMGIPTSDFAIKHGFYTPK